MLHNLIAGIPSLSCEIKNAKFSVYGNLLLWKNKRQEHGLLFNSIVPFLHCLN